MKRDTSKTRRSFLGLNSLPATPISTETALRPDSRGLNHSSFAMSRRTATKVLIAGVGLLLAACKGDEGGKSKEPEEVRPSNFEIIKGFKPSPEHATIVESEMNDPTKKTIIYIVDAHPSPETSLESQAAARGVQKKLFLILDELLQKTGSLPIVMENWPIELSGRRLGNFEDISSEVTGIENQAILREIFDEPNETRRRQLIIENMYRFNIPGTIFAQLAFPDQMRSIGSIPYSELERILRQDREIHALGSIEANPELVACDDSGQLTLKAATEKFANGDRSDEVTSCYCDVRGQLQAIADEYVKDRGVSAPRFEVQAAINDRSDFAIISAGTNHLPEARKMMKAEGVNWIVIAPKGTEDDFPKALTTTTLGQIKNPLPNTDPKTCETWEAAERLRLEEVRRKQEEAFIEWFNEE
jgi:hypothetical protein